MREEEPPWNWPSEEEEVTTPPLPVEVVWKFWQIDWVLVLNPNWETGCTTPEAFAVELETEMVSPEIPPRIFEKKSGNLIKLRSKK